VHRHKADSKLVKKEVNGTVILPPLVFPGLRIRFHLRECSETATTNAGYHAKPLCTNFKLGRFAAEQEVHL